MIITLAFKNLVYDKVRLAVTLTGVIVAVVLITVQLGLFFGFSRAICDIIDHTEADIWMTPRGIPNYEQVVPMSDHPLHRMLSVPGVVQVGKMVTQFVPWKKHSGGQQVSIIVGFDVNARMFAPWNVISGRPEALQLPDTVIIDSLYKEKLEVARLGDTAEINGHRVRVVGITRGIRSFTTSPFVFTSLKNSQQYARLKEDQVTYLLVRISSDKSPEEMRDRLKAGFPELDVYTKREFRDKTQKNWIFETGAGAGIFTAAIMALVVGIVVVAQTLYASTIDHINEFATLRAMGADNGFLYSIIVLQAVISAIVGYALGIGIGFTIANASEAGVTAIVLTPQLAVWMFFITLVMCVVAAVTSVRKVTRLEPAMVFKG
jgi:putative ABC transport system permease protein